MIKKTSMLILMIVGLVFGLQAKVGLINPQRVLQESIKGKEVLKKLESIQAQKQKEYETRQAEIAKLEKDILNPALNAEARDRKNLELQEKRTQLKRFAEDAQNEITKIQQQEFEKLQRELNPIIEKIAKEKGFTIILDISISGVAYADPAVDISKDVIEAFNSQHTKK